MDTFGDLLSDLQSMLLISLSNNANFVELTPTAVNEESAIKYMKNIIDLCLKGYLALIQTKIVK